MPRNLDLGLTKDLLEVADTKRPAEEEVHDAQAGPVAKALMNADQIHGGIMRAAVYAHKHIFPLSRRTSSHALAGRRLKRSNTAMGLFNALLGTASEIDAGKLEAEFSKLLVEGETILNAYQLFRDLIVFTDLRFFVVDKQGLTGKKRNYLSVPYRSVDLFAQETSGTFDLDAEIKIWIKGRPNPLSLEFRKDSHIHDVFRVLSLQVLRP